MKTAMSLIVFLAMGGFPFSAQADQVTCEVTGHYKKASYWSMDYPHHYYPNGMAHPYMGNQTMDVTYQEVFGDEPSVLDATTCLAMTHAVVGATYEPPFGNRKVKILWGTMRFEEGNQTVTATIENGSLRLRSVETEVAEYSPEAVQAVHELVTGSIGPVSNVSYKIKYKARKDKLVVRAWADLE